MVPKTTGVTDTAWQAPTIEPVDEKAQWTPSLEDYVKAIGEEAQGYRILHSENARRYALYCNVQTYLNCGFAAASGLAATLGMIFNPGPSIVYPVISATIVFLLAVTGPLFKQQKYDQLELMHRQAVTKFTNLENNVRRCMALPPEHRIPPGPYTAYLDNALTVNIDFAPLISEASLARYKKRVMAKKDGEGMAIPLQPTRVKVHSTHETEKEPLKTNVSFDGLRMSELCAHVDPEMRFELERHDHWNRRQLEYKNQTPR